MAKLHDELRSLNSMGVEDIARELKPLDNWDRRADMLSAYLSPRLNYYVAVFGNSVNLTGLPFEGGSRHFYKVTDRASLANFPNVRAFVMRN